MKLLFVSRDFSWPLRLGSSVHAGNIMKSMVRQGHQVTLLTEKTLDHVEAIRWLEGIQFTSLDALPMGDTIRFRPSYLQYRAHRFLGVESEPIAKVGEFVTEHAFDATIAISLRATPYLSGIPKSVSKKCWYAADDPLLALWAGTERFSTSAFLKMFVLQRCFRKSVDVVWVVSQRDAWWSRKLGGWKSVVTVANGVDEKSFVSVAQSDRRTEPKAICFWGNLGFGPNIDALEYFLKGPWLEIVRRVTQAEFWIAGSNPTGEIRTLMESTPGVKYLGEVDSIPEALGPASIAVFPFQSGAGIKNKVLEAAAMEKSILISSIAVNGLMGEYKRCMRVIDSKESWVSSIIEQMNAPKFVQDNGKKARDWVIACHSWGQSAKIAIESLQ